MMMMREEKPFFLLGGTQDDYDIYSHAQLYSTVVMYLADSKGQSMATAITVFKYESAIK